MRGAIPPLANTSSWCDTQLSKGTILPSHCTQHIPNCPNLTQSNLEELHVNYASESK
jgi:hypothetical protein